MVFNMTATEEYSFQAINSAIQAAMFLTLVLPALILCFLSVLALLCTKTINWQMKALLINLFSAKVGGSLASTLLYLGYPVRASGNNAAEDYFCRFIASTFITTSLTKSTAITIYSVMIYTFVKHGFGRMQQYAILSTIAISWVIGITVGMLPYMDAFGVIDDYGFCESIPHSQLYLIPLGIAVLPVMAICITLTLVFSSLTYFQVHKNTLEESGDLRLAVAYNFLFLMMASFFIIINNTIPVIFPILQSMDYTNKGRLIMDYSVQFLFDLSALLLPILALILLKPVQIALKVMFGLCSTTCCKRRF